MKYYVYIYFDKKIKENITINNIEYIYQPFYVGKGIGKRHKDHLSICYKQISPFYSKLKTMLENDNHPQIEIIKWFDNEDDAYTYERELIKEIGSRYIENIKNGTLKNMIIDSSNPPNHKNKTYLEIYKTKERAEYERKRRHDNQLNKGGYFRGRKHSDDSKKKISLKSKSINNPMYGKKHSQKTINKIIQNRKLPTGRDNKYGKFYIAVSPNNDEYVLYGSELTKFCIERNLSKSTLKKTLVTNKRVCHGKTKDWILKYDTDSTL